jgi:choline-glycine betaine transporter
MMAEEQDDIEKLEAKETANKLPVGWLILFWGLIIWGVYYFVSYTPAISGWSQGKAYEESIKR